MQEKITRLIQNFEKEQQNPQGIERGHFYNQIEYMFAVIGFGIGYGTFWRFPYLIYQNGGSCFLIPYFILLIFMGIPLFYMENAMGQMLQKSSPKVFASIHPSLKLVGFISVFIAFNLSTYYNVILSYSYVFFLYSFKYPLPWIENNDKQDILNNKSQSINQYGGINMLIFIVYIVSLIICYFAISGGLKITGKITLLTASLPYVMLAILLIKGLFLQKAIDGISYLLTPDLTNLFSPKVYFNKQIWMDAASQIFLQYSIGCSSLIMFSSYRQKHHRFDKVTYIIVIATVVYGMLAALIIFSYISHFCYVNELKMENLNISGPALAFIVFPQVLIGLPMPNLWALLFFFTLILLGIDSQFGFMQSVICAFEDEFRQKDLVLWGKVFPHKRIRILVTCLISVFVILYSSKAGFYIMTYVDICTCNIPMAISVLLQLYFFTKYVPFAIIEYQIQKYTGHSAPKFIKNMLEGRCLLLITIILLIIAVINQIVSMHNYNLYMNLLGWTLILYPLVLAYYYFHKNKGLMTLFYYDNNKLKLNNQT